MRPRAIDWIGRRFGKLVVTELLGYTHNPSIRRYRLLCDCGNVVTALSTLLYGRMTCCGCSRKVRRVRHGLYRSAEYRIWRAMWTRCTNPNHRSYHNYGGRGITIDARWKDFTAFYADMGERPSAKHSIDRVNNNCGYGPDNCRWATMAEQLRNRRTPAECKAARLNAEAAQ